MDEIKFTVETDPRPLARARFNGRRCYQPKVNTDYRQIVQSAAKMAMCGREPLSGGIKVAVNLYRKYQPTAQNFGDVDNHVKAILDALTGIIFGDDSQVVTCTVAKFTDKVRPRAEVSICPVTVPEPLLSA